MSLIADRVRRLLGIDVGELAGSVFAGETPLTDTLVNQLIALRLAATNSPVAAVRVEAHDGNRLDVLVSMRAAIVPDVKVALQIEQQPDFPGNPALSLRWSVPALGAFTRFAAPALAFFKRLPPGIRADGDRIVIDVAELLRWRGLGELVDYLTRLQVTTREGAIVVEFALRVPPRYAEPSPRVTST